MSQKSKVSVHVSTPHTRHRRLIRSHADQHMHTARNISSLRAQSSSHASTLAAQVTETQDMQTQIASLTLTRDAHSSSVAALRVRLAAANGTLESRRATQRQQRMYIERQGARDAPEIAAWEDLLGLRIEGAGVADRVRFVFPALGDGNEEVAGSATSGRWQRDREAFFDLDMDPRAGVGYEVVECRPRLDADAVNACLRSMREREDLRGFLRGMRRLFVDEFAR